MRMNRAEQFLFMWECPKNLYLVGLIDRSNYCTSGRTLKRAKAGTTHALGTTTKPAITATAPTTTTSWKETTGGSGKVQRTTILHSHRGRDGGYNAPGKKMNLFDISGIRQTRKVVRPSVCFYKFSQPPHRFDSCLICLWDNRCAWFCRFYSYPPVSFF